MSPCGKVDIIQDVHSDTNALYSKSRLGTWSSTELPQHNTTLYVNVAEYVNLSKELQKVSDQRSKLLQECEKLKKKSEERKELVSQEDIEKFNAQMKILNDKETLLNKI